MLRVVGVSDVDRPVKAWGEFRLEAQGLQRAGFPLFRLTPEQHLVILAVILARTSKLGLLHPVLDTHQQLTGSSVGRCDPIDRDRLVVAAAAEGTRGRVAAPLRLAACDRHPRRCHG